MSPASKWIAVFVHDASGEIVLCEYHCAARFVVGQEGDGTTGHFKSKVGEGLLGNVETGLLDVHVCSVKIVFHNCSNVVLDEQSILAYFFELMSFVF